MCVNVPTLSPLRQHLKGPLARILRENAASRHANARIFPLKKPVYSLQGDLVLHNRNA